MVQVVVLKRRRVPGAGPLNDKPKSRPSAALLPHADAVVKVLHDLGSRARRLRPPMNSKPEAFHEDRSELARDLDLLAECVRGGRNPDQPR